MDRAVFDRKILVILDFLTMYRYYFDKSKF